MKPITTNKDLAEHGLTNIANLDIGFAMSLMVAGKLVCSAGQSRLASRAADGKGRKLSMTLNRYYVIEGDGSIWPVEIGRLRREGEEGHSMPPLGTQRLPISAVDGLHPHLAMKLDVGQRALLRVEAMPLVQEVYPLLGWQAEFDRCTIHYNPRAAALSALVMVRRTA